MKHSAKIPLVLTVLTIALTGCTSLNFFKSKEEKAATKPAELPKIVATQSLQRIFAAHVADDPKHQPLRLQLASQQDTYFSADAKGNVVAYSNTGNKKRWDVNLGKKVELTAGVVVDQDLLVVGSRSGVLYALDSQTGQVKWQQQLSGAILNQSLVGQNTIITVTNDGNVYANDRATGQQIWAFDLPAVALSVRGYASPVMIDNNTVLIASANAYVYALDASTGIPKWQRRVAISEGRSEAQRLIDIDAQPIVVGDKLVTVSYQGQVTVTDLPSQQVVWSQPANSINTPAVTNQAIYIANNDGSLVAYDLYTGNKLWESNTLLRRKLSNPVIVGNELVVGDYDGFLHLIDPTTGELNGREKTKGLVRTLRSDNGLLFVSTTKGDLSVWQQKP